MNSKERVRSAILHRQPDRVPIDYHARSEITSALMEHLGVDSEEHLRENPPLCVKVCMGSCLFIAPIDKLSILAEKRHAMLFT